MTLGDLPTAQLLAIRQDPQVGDHTKQKVDVELWKRRQSGDPGAFPTREPADERRRYNRYNHERRTA